MSISSFSASDTLHSIRIKKSPLRKLLINPFRDAISSCLEESLLTTESFLFLFKALSHCLKHLFVSFFKISVPFLYQHNGSSSGSIQSASFSRGRVLFAGATRAFRNCASTIAKVRDASGSKGKSFWQLLLHYMRGYRSG